MEWILIGIAIAIGFYLAPVVLTIIGAVLYGAVAIIASIFRGIFGGGR